MTLNWIQQSVLDTTGGWDNDTPSAPATAGNDDILALEPEAVALADSEGPDAALGWLQTRPGMTTDRQKWLLRLLMGRIAEQVDVLRGVEQEVVASAPVILPHGGEHIVDVEV